MLFVSLVTMWKLLTPRVKRTLLFLVLSSLLISFLETISLSALMLFISLNTHPTELIHHRYLAPLYHWTGFLKHNDFIVFFGILLIGFYLVRAGINMIHTYFFSSFSSMQHRHFAIKAFATFLTIPYQLFTTQNTTHVSQAIFTYSRNIEIVLSNALSITTELCTVGSLYLMLLFMSWKITLTLTVTMLTVLSFVMRFFAKQVNTAGKQSNECMHAAAKITNNSFWNFKFLTLIGEKNILQKDFENHLTIHAQAYGHNLFSQLIPRFILETVGFILLILLLLYLAITGSNPTATLPLISMYALAFYRVLPSLNKVMASYQQIVFNHHAIMPLASFLQTPTEAMIHEEITFTNTLILNNLTFAYEKNNPVLQDISLTIHKGTTIGFVGENGGGKSTLLDIIMGLIQPQAGSILVDDKPIELHQRQSWRKKIGYIPQTIFLYDGTVAENIVCGRAYDEANILHVLKQASLYDFFMAQNGINTAIGENGITLSGGQKQRVALARALYGNPEIIILDEATSALDSVTEKKIMDEIYTSTRDKTVLIIAHRTSTLALCSQVYRVENRQLSEVLLQDSNTRIGLSRQPLS